MSPNTTFSHTQLPPPRTTVMGNYGSQGLSLHFTSCCKCCESSKGTHAHAHKHARRHARVLTHAHAPAPAQTHAQMRTHPPPTAAHFIGNIWGKAQHFHMDLPQTRHCIRVLSCFTHEQRHCRSTEKSKIGTGKASLPIGSKSWTERSVVHL
jgi:hypothetical protein